MKVELIILFLAGKLFEFLPFFLEKAIYLITNLIFSLLESAGMPAQKLASLALTLKNFSYFSVYFFFIIPIFVLLVPIMIGRKSQNKKIIKIYWLFSTLVDLFLVIKFSFPCNSGLMIGFCNVGIIFGLILFLLGLILRSIGTVVALRPSRRREKVL